MTASSKSSGFSVSQSPSLPVSTSPSLARHGLTLLEVLVSMGILAIGILGMASLISLGKLSLMRTEEADRTGACGRAGMHEVKVRKMLDANLRYPNASSAGTNTFFIDPLGYYNVSNSLASLPRISLKTSPTGSSMTLPQAQSIFLLQDELTYALPEDMANGQTPTNGLRPMPVVSTGSSTQAIDGHYSWFLTVWPAPTERSLMPSNPEMWKNYLVSVVVCKNRQFSSGTNSTADDTPGECDYSGGSASTGSTATPGYCGTTIEIPSSSGRPAVKDGEWVFLHTNAQCAWYRAVSSGYDESANATRMTLVGPDWYGGTSNVNVLVVRGVTGVYTTTVKLDNDGTWSK